MLIASFLLLALLHFSASLVLYLRARKGSQGRALVVLLSLSISTLLWNIANIFLLDDPFVIQNLATASIVNKFAFATAVGIAYFSYSFTSHFPRALARRRRDQIVAYVTVIIMILCFTSQLSGEIYTVSDIETGYNQGPLVTVFIATILFLSIGAARNLIRSSKIEKDRSLRRQSRTILGGLFAMILMALIFILVLPTFGIDEAWTYVLGYFSSYIFTGAILYSMLRQQLFDIKGVLARAAAYVLVFASFILIYFMAAFALTSIIYNFIDINEAGKRFIDVAIVVVLAVAYQPLKRFFDKIAEKIFYRQTYDSQDVIGDLGDITSKEVILKKLVSRSLHTLQQFLQTNGITILFPDKQFVLENKSSKDVLISERSLENADKIFALDKHLSADVLEISDRQVQTNPLLLEYFQEYGIECLVKLSTNQGVVGYILLREKKSGDLYTRKDHSMLLIIRQQLSVALENAERFEQISNFNKELQHKIDRATADLRKTNEKLKQMDETKDEFISMASHQLRTPLTSVKGYLSMVLEGDAGKLNEQQTKLLSQAFTSSQRMVYLIADLLNVSRLRTGKFVIDTSPSNLPEVIKGEISQLTETAAARGLTLTFNDPKDFPILNLDETKIRQVIMNFVDNAIYYTPAGGHINIVLTATDKAVDFKVIDDGLGVPKSEQHHLFNKFYRAENAKRARPDGTGLGLFMAKKVVIAQGGAIIFESKEGQGSTFGFTFPRHELEVKKDAR